MFLLKKTIAALFLPLPICSLLLVIGLLFLWFTARQRLGRLLVSIGAVTLLLFSNPTIPNRLLRTLEGAYAPLLGVPQEGVPLIQTPVKWIVVMGAGYPY